MDAIEQDELGGEVEAEVAAQLKDQHAKISPEKHDPYAALRFRDFRLTWLGRFVAILGEQMLIVAIGWELYERTGQEIYLGLVGLVQIIPVILLALPSGHIADRYNRKKVALSMQLLLTVASIGLAVLSATHGPLLLVYGCLLLMGIGRSLKDPAITAFVSQSVPPEHFTSAATWSSSAWQLAAVMGPALGGLIIAVFKSATLVYVCDVFAGLIFIALVSQVVGRKVTLSRERPTLRSLSAGFSFIWRTKVILAAITLDLFAVLLGGAVALLPVYAKDILQVGPVGLGALQAAPSIGAILMALIIASRPPFAHAGRMLIIAVIGFGIATIIFGVSQNFILSLAMLFALGAMDNISVVIRSTLLLVKTPDEMRGRISAVNNIFVGSSNELGRFESGATAQLFNSAPISVVFGGVGTILVVIVVALIWPEMRRLERLAEG